ncbi:type 1 glutamine amidotransferase domain-containing protein [Furfurilactobacillus sp. WILCCON 0119]
MKKVLVVETNTQQYGAVNEPTGLWLGESAEFVDEMQKAGVAVDYVSPLGGFVPLDPRSMKYVDTSIMGIYEDDDFIERGLKNTLAPAAVDPDDYVAIYYTGGHGVMWDFPDNPELQALAAAIYKNNGYVMSVCHGIAGLFNIKDEHGQNVISGKTITGFTATEELIAGKRKVVPFLNRDMAVSRNATFKQKWFYADYAVQDDRLITGQNPFSVRSVAKLFLNAVGQLN